jgi:hypothetical protein
MIRDAWLAFKLHRFEVVTVVALSLGLGIVALVVWRMLEGMSGPPRCIEDRFLIPVPPECANTESAVFISNEYAGKVMAAMAALPFVGGVLLGVPLVAPELERRTASLVWSLSGSRGRWFLGRLAPFAILLAAVLSVPAVAAGLLEGVLPGGYDPAASFMDYGLRGPVVVARGLFALGIAVLAGAVIGRVLPALIVSGIACVIAFNAHGVLMPFGQRIELLPAMSLSGAQERYDFTVYTGPEVFTGDASTESPRYGVPGERLREVEAREVAVLVVGFLVLAGVSLVVVDRRRPY